MISPPPKVEVDVSYTFVINCTAMGIPTPEVIWRLNWGHVPDKCRQGRKSIDIFLPQNLSQNLFQDMFGVLNCLNF